MCMLEDVNIYRCYFMKIQLPKVPELFKFPMGLFLIVHFSLKDTEH